MERVDLEQFISANKIKKQDLAAYLGISNAFVTQLCNGARPLPGDKLALLKQNPYGWDTTALTSPAPTISTKVSGNGKANVQVGDNNHMDSDTELKMKVAVLEKENELLKEQIDFLKSLLRK